MFSSVRAAYFLLRTLFSPLMGFLWDLLLLLQPRDARASVGILQQTPLRWWLSILFCCVQCRLCTQVSSCCIVLQLSILSIIMLSWNVSRVGLDSVILFLHGLHLIFFPSPFLSRLMAAFPTLSQFQMVSRRGIRTGTIAFRAVHYSSEPFCSS